MNISIETVLSKRDQYAKRRVKIVATIGPATSSESALRDLINAGANVFRLNFSHGDHEGHLAVLKSIRKVSEELESPVAILQDLAGPKIRISEFGPEFKQGSITVKAGDKLTVKHGSEKGTQNTLFIPSVDPTNHVSKGSPALLADGAIQLEVDQILDDGITLLVTKGGNVRSRVGIAFPGSNIPLDAVTEKDIKDLSWGIKNEVDYVALSFVNSGEDVQKVQDLIDKEKGVARVIAKIERASALENIEGILDTADGIMIARGDLGLEVSLEKLPVLQKILVNKCNQRGIITIVATQMLLSMVEKPTPTRAETSDVATAVSNGADAVMLSEETAIGKYPTESVSFLNRIALETERRLKYEDFRWDSRGADQETVSDALVFAACGAAEKVKAAAIIACTTTGTSARLTAKYRPMQPLYGASTKKSTLRRMCLYWGVEPVFCDTANSHKDEVETALAQVQLKEKLANGSRAVITGGLKVHTPGATSVLEIREMNELS